MTTLQQQAESDSAPWLIANRNAETLSAAGIFGKRQSATSGLTWAFYGGLYNGNTIADGAVTLTNTATNYVVVLRSTGVVSTSTSSANSINPLYAKLYQLTTSGGVVTAEVDQRWDANGLFFSGGGSGTAANIPAQRYVVELLNTTDSDPGAGLVRFNNATPASATALFIDDSTSDGVDLSSYYAGLGATGYITIQSASDAGEWAIFRWTAITDQTGYFRFTVTAYASLGTLDDADAVVIAFDSDAVGGGGAVATDVIWDAVGDLAVGSGANTAVRLARGSALQVLRVNAGGTDLEYATPITGSTIGQHMLPVMASAMTPRSTGGCGTLVIDGGASDQPDIPYLPFDAATQEGADFSVPMPESWNEGAITFKPIWKHQATTVNFGVVWRLRAVAFSDDDAMASSFGTGQTSTDTGGTTRDHYVGPTSAAITIAGSPAAGDTVYFNIERIVSDGGDTMAVDAELIGVRIYFTTAAETD